MTTAQVHNQVVNAKITTIYKVISMTFDEENLPKYQVDKGATYYTEEGFKKHFHNGRKLLYCQRGPKLAEPISTDELCKHMVSNGNHEVITLFGVDETDDPIRKLMKYEPIEYYAILSINVNV